MNLLVQQACNHPELEYSRQRDGKAAPLREKREKEEYPGGVHTLHCFDAHVKAWTLIQGSLQRMRTLLNNIYSVAFREMRQYKNIGTHFVMLNKFYLS